MSDVDSSSLRDGLLGEISTFMEKEGINEIGPVTMDRLAGELEGVVRDLADEVAARLIMDIGLALAPSNISRVVEEVLATGLYTVDELEAKSLTNQVFSRILRRMRSKDQLLESVKRVSRNLRTEQYHLLGTHIEALMYRWERWGVTGEDKRTVEWGHRLARALTKQTPLLDLIPAYRQYRQER